MLDNHFSSKLLLFGEHTVVRGSSALAIPYTQFHGHWDWLSDTTDGSLQQNLKDFAIYLQSLEKEHILLADLQLEEFSRDLEMGLYFASNIPTGYGLGSSGALSAAVYDRFASHRPDKGNPKHYPILKEILAQMESFFHGSSSGTDPLICYLNRPTLIQPNGIISTVELPDLSTSNLTFFLLDTKIRRSTGPLVAHFLAKCKDPTFLKKINTTLVSSNEAAIQSFLKGAWENLYKHFEQISQFQLQHLQEMTPKRFLPIWQKGLEEQVFYLKLCGAGGGGFLLGMTRNMEATKVFLKEEQLLLINEF